MSAPINLSRTARAVLCVIQEALAEYGLIGALVTGGKHHKLIVRLPKGCKRPIEVFSIPLSPSGQRYLKANRAYVHRAMRTHGVARLQQQPRRRMSS
jgi:hypothetical protein